MSNMIFTIEEIEKLYTFSLGDLIARAGIITKEQHGRKVEFCSIVSVKTGHCSQDCKYCAQSIHYNTDIKHHNMLDLEKVREAALSARENGATRFCIVTSGKNPDSVEFDQLLEMIRLVDSITGLQSCCSLGTLTEQQVLKIKEAGCKRYNHNINTASSYHDQVVTTHSYRDRINTIVLLQQNGIEVCAGCIIGMGETRKQRAEMIYELAGLHPVSVPINILNPIKGTPFEDKGNAISEEEVLKTIAIFRIVMPGALLRYAGGRTSRLSHASQKSGIEAGINALLVGNHLTVTGSDPSADYDMICSLGKELIQGEQN